MSPVDNILAVVAHFLHLTVFLWTENVNLTKILFVLGRLARMDKQLYISMDEQKSTPTLLQNFRNKLLYNLCLDSKRNIVNLIASTVIIRLYLSFFRKMCIS